MSDQARILIAGGGVGGLTLAQALRRGGLDVAVYERDPTPTIRNQGYRIHIDPDGNGALRACLPAEVLDLVRDTSGLNGDLVASYTPHLEQVMAQEFPGVGDDAITNVDRNTFRRGLLDGLAEHVHFGKTVAGYRITGSGRVRVEFAEGGSDEGDVLVGADGNRSAIRRQLLPHATVKDLGLRCLYGRMTITGATEPLIPAAFNRGFIWVADEKGRGAGFAPVRFRSQAGRPDYLMTTFVTTQEGLGVPDEELFTLPPEALRTLTMEAIADWHPAIQELFAHADRDMFFPITIRASERVEAWPSGPVTLLGDAIHAMPPTGGVGANTALRDAATLASELLAAARGAQSLTGAVAAYERVMLPRGFDTVDNSLRLASQMFGWLSHASGRGPPPTGREGCSQLPPSHLINSEGET